MKYRIVEYDDSHWVDEMQRNVSREEFLLMLKEARADLMKAAPDANAAVFVEQYSDAGITFRLGINHSLEDLGLDPEDPYGDGPEEAGHDFPVSSTSDAIHDIVIVTRRIMCDSIGDDEMTDDEVFDLIV